MPVTLWSNDCFSIQISLECDDHSNFDNLGAENEGVAQKKAYVANEVLESFENLKSPPKSDHRIIQTKSVALINTILRTVESSSSSDVDALNELNKQLTSSLSTFEAMTKFKNVNNIKPVTNEPANKNLEKQVNFYSTKKKRKCKGNVRFAKPTQDDLNKFFNVKPWEGGYDTASLKGIQLF